MGSLFGPLERTFAKTYRRWAQRRWSGSREAVLDAARSTMRRKRYCVLATHAPEGIQARVVQPYPPRSDFSVLIGTSAASRKVAQLDADPRATLIYEDDARAACVTLIGRAELRESSSPDDKRFMPSWHAFWPRGAADEDFVNVRFVPHAIEVWDAYRGITPEPFGLASARLERRCEAWTLVAAPELLPGVR